MHDVPVTGNVLQPVSLSQASDRKLFALFQSVGWRNPNAARASPGSKLLEPEKGKQIGAVSQRFRDHSVIIQFDIECVSYEDHMVIMRNNI